MKRVVSVSLGSSKRDKSVEIELGGEKVNIERIGTDGDIKEMRKKYEELDDKVDAFGIGGTNHALYVNGRVYPLPEFKDIRKGIKTKIFDGEGIKEVLEEKIADFIENNSNIVLKGKRGYMPSAVDRYSMALSLEKAGVKMWYGDFASALHLPIYLPSLKYINFVAPIIIPPILNGISFFGIKLWKGIPFKELYPTGEKQEKTTTKKIKQLENAEIIAGDCLYIKDNLPESLEGKIIITNTTTEEDVKLFERKGISYLITTTPRIEGRSFGTNVMEAVFYACGYHNKIKEGAEKLGIKPEIKKLRNLPKK